MASEYLLNKPDGSSINIGSHYEQLDEAHLDINAWIGFLLDKGYKKIILQGHSLGTIKVIRYLFEGKYKSKINKLILLCPFDKTFLIEKFTTRKYIQYLKQAKKKILEGKGDEIVPKNYGGFKLSYQTYLSWFDNNDLSHMFDLSIKNYKFPILNKINIPVHVIVGTNDEYFYQSDPKHPEIGFRILINNLKKGGGKLIKNATHSFAGYEKTVALEVLKFAKSK